MQAVVAFGQTASRKIVESNENATNAWNKKTSNKVGTRHVAPEKRRLALSTMSRTDVTIAEKRRQALTKRCHLLLERCLAARQERGHLGPIARPRLHGWLSEQDGLACLQLSVSEPTPMHLPEVLKHLSLDSFSVDSAGLLVKYATATWNSNGRCWDLPLRPCCVYESSWETRLREVRAVRL